jgi:hypothetical protein
MEMNRAMQDKAKANANGDEYSDASYKSTYI